MSDKVAKLKLTDYDKVNFHRNCIVNGRKCRTRDELSRILAKREKAKFSKILGKCAAMPKIREQMFEYQEWPQAIPYERHIDSGYDTDLRFPCLHEEEAFGTKSLSEEYDFEQPIDRCSYNPPSSSTSLSENELTNNVLDNKPQNVCKSNKNTMIRQPMQRQSTFDVGTRNQKLKSAGSTLSLCDELRKNSILKPNLNTNEIIQQIASLFAQLQDTLHNAKDSAGCEPSNSFVVTLHSSETEPSCVIQPLPSLPTCVEKTPVALTPRAALGKTTERASTSSSRFASSESMSGSYTSSYKIVKPKHFERSKTSLMRPEPRQTNFYTPRQ